MAENDQQQADRTEQPSEKKLADARRRGRVPRSRELGMAAVMLAGSGVFLVLQPMFAAGLAKLFGDGLSIGRERVMSTLDPVDAIFSAVLTAARFMWPLLGVLVVAAIAGSIAIGGWTFSTEQLAPKFEKLNPAQGLKRIFGWSGVSELGKALLKFLVVGVVAIALMWLLAPEFLRLGRLGVEQALGRTAWLTALCFAGFSAGLLLIVAYDVPFQLWHFRRQMRMTKQEVKDEQKETEGRPEIRQRIRQMQHDIATRRMLAEVPKADVILVNPQHFAVALRYDAKQMRAPRVLARGTDRLALSIRRIAAAHAVPVFEHPPLARAVYYTADVGQEISPELYFAVAQVLTYVYQLTGRTPTKPGQKPERPDPKIADELLMTASERRRAARGVAG